MAADGLRTFVEVGPGKVLTGLIRRIERGAGRVNVFDRASADAARAELSS
jgi:[acyl-carrier-protein] S-malonyltransferase